MGIAYKGRIALPSLKKIILLIITVIGSSILLIRHYEGISWMDSFFMVIDSMTHAHFGNYPKVVETKLLMVFLTIFGVGLLVYFISFLVDFFLSGKLMEAMGLRKIEKEIEQMKDHIILCGYGRVGSVVGSELRGNNIPFVVIDNNSDLVEKLRMDGILAIWGDATDTSALKEAGIDRSNFLVTVLGDDSETIVAILAAKEARPSIRIIARSGSEGMARRMLQIGAERIILPEYVGGLEIAQSIVHKQLGKTKGLFSEEDFENK
ncbi:MAG: potassium channel family protein [Candidatus Methanofastidiosa archaeon]|nr:potassium channel family protein [Candidatus Methanofastidiosa archaeon]